MSKVERWERRAEVPLILLAFAFLGAYAWPVLDPRMDPSLRSFFTAVSWTIYAVFALDLVIRLTLAEERRRYALAHWYDVALVTLPVLRPLRLLRLVVGLCGFRPRPGDSPRAGRGAQTLRAGALV
ncbi:MAG TPA: hypothetical protein VMZ66_14880 [Aeromicrobium sp.]|nr:hypothetical protein [Aeromicrobium sp.]